MSIPGWLPNAISTARLATVPVWLWLAETLESGRVLAAVLIILGVSDVVDGWLARRFSLTSRVGATLDAVADKLAQLSFVTYLTFWGGAAFVALPVWFWGVVFGRDAALSIGYAVMRSRLGAVDTEHRLHGKVSSLLLFLVVLFALLPEVSADVTIITCWVSAAVIVVSTVAYVGQGVRSLRGSRPASPGTPPPRAPRPP